MALTAPTGLSTSQKDRLERFDPVMDSTNAIPAAFAAKTDVSTLISELLSTASGKGASQIGIQDSGGLFTATTVEGALAELAGAVIDTANALISATPSTQLGLERHIKVTTPGGATFDTDTALPPGTWEPTRVEVINRAVGTAGDTIQVIAQGIGTITDAMDVNKSDAVITRPTSLAAGVNMVGGTNALRVTETDGAGNDSPACDVHVWLRQVA